MSSKKSTFLKSIKKYLLRVFIGPLFIRLLKIYLRFVFWSSEVKIENIEGFRDCVMRASVVLLWHHNIILAPHVIKNCYKGSRFVALSSQHQDGKLLKDFIRLYGYDTISGSARNGGINAAREMIAALKGKKQTDNHQNNNKEQIDAAEGFSVITAADGPIGPLMVAKDGMILLGLKNSAPIAGLYIAATKTKILSTWDKLMIPLPFGKIKCSFNILSHNELNKTNDLTKKDFAKQTEAIRQQLVDEAISLHNEMGCKEYDRPIIIK